MKQKETRMTEMRAGTSPASPTSTAAPAARDRRGFRIALLSVAATIVLIGATTAGVYGYAAIAFLR
jgi:hypothetical protein